MSKHAQTTTKKFQPLTPHDLDIQNELIQMARNAKNITSDADRKLETDLASVLIYSNIAEYLAENLLENLNHFVKKSTYKDFAGILYIESVSSDDRNMTLGMIVKQLKKFSFPDKDGILGCFKKISESRNRIFHNFAKSDLGTITGLVGDDLPIIQDECEDLILRVNTIYEGLKKILNPQVYEEPQDNVS